MQLVTIIEMRPHNDGTTTVLVQLNDFDLVDDPTAGGTNATHVLQSVDLRGQLIDLYPNAEIHTANSLNVKITTHLLKLGRRVYNAEGTLISPDGVVKKAAIKANLEQQALLAQAVMLSSPAVDASPEL